MSTSWVTRWKYSIATKSTKPGVFRMEKGGYLVRVNNAIRALPGASLQEALAVREALRTKPKTSRPLFGAFAVSLLEERILLGKISSTATRERWESSLRLYLIPHFGGIPLDELEPAVLSFVKELATWIRYGKPSFKDPKKNVTFAESTANGILRILQTICNIATARFNLSRNPFVQVEFFEEKPPHTPDAPNALPPDVVRRFLEIAKAEYPQHYAMMLLGFVTGLRPSSLRALRKHVDIVWDKNQLLVRRSNSRGDEVMEKTKTGYATVINMPVEIMDVLWEHLQELPPGPMRESQYMFPSETGGPKSRTALDKPFKAIAKKLGVNYKVSPKAMRRSFQDLARAAQVENVVTRSISGHRTEEMQAHYSTVWSPEQKEALERLFNMVAKS